ncbi:MAG TPA: carboxymuconolactone decarboxylase family protein [Archangium sp.]|jgi:alkylhydroperoxidase/carboxymuconolactone decarboxylase family protein YurZ
MDRKQVERELSEAFGVVPEWSKVFPDDELVDFWKTVRDLELAPTQIPAKFKALMGLAVAVATKSANGERFHAEAARLHGATEDEIREATLLASQSVTAAEHFNAIGLDPQAFEHDTTEQFHHLREQMSGQSWKPAVRASNTPA